MNAINTIQNNVSSRNDTSPSSYTESRLLNLSSQTATVKNNGAFLSNVEYFLTGLIKADEHIDKIEIQLLNAQIPVSFYIINYTNNLFRIKLDTDPIQTLTVPVGNYNANTLITELKTLINDTNFQITISQITGKLTFAHNKSFIIYNNFTGSIGSVLGFDNNSTNSSISNSLTTPNILNLLGIKRITVLSNEVPCSNYSSNYGGACTLLASIPVEATLWGMINYHNHTNTKHLVKVNEIERIDIQLLDEYGNYINFNNCDWTMTFNIDITYKFQVASVPINPLEKTEINKPNDLANPNDLISFLQS